MKARIAAWRAAFEGDENAIVPTLCNYAWNHCAFMSIVESIRGAPKDEDGAPKVNAMVLDMLASGYWSSTLLAVRRLVDNQPLRGPKGVSSLRSIVNDVRACQGRLTRRVYVEQIAGLEYNYEQVRHRYWNYVLAQQGPTWVPRELHFEASEHRHAEFDFLSGKTPGTSSDEDLIEDRIFDRLDERLSRLDAIATHVTLHFAHAATRASRAGRELEQWSLDEAKQSLKLLVETAELIGRWFVYSGVGHVLPTPQGDQFKYFDQPLSVVPRQRMQELWDAFDVDSSQWHQVDNAEV